MDASTRSFHVYGKTASGASAIKAARGALTTMARRVLILVDGQRSVGELSDMLGMEAVETALAELESLGHIEFLRRFTDPSESQADAGRTPADTASEFAADSPPTMWPADPAVVDETASVTLDIASAPVPAAVPPVSPQASTQVLAPANLGLQSTTAAPPKPVARSAGSPVPPAAMKEVAHPMAPAIPVSKPTTSQRPPAPATLQATGNPAVLPPAVPAAKAPVPVAPVPAPPNVQRPGIKPVAWQPPATAPIWARVLLVVGGTLAIGVWLSARLFFSDPVSPRVAPAPAPSGSADAAAPKSPASAAALPATEASATAPPAAAAPGAGAVPGAAVAVAPTEVSTGVREAASATHAIDSPPADTAPAEVVASPAAGSPTARSTGTGSIALPAAPGVVPAHMPTPTPPPAPVARTLHVHTQFTPEIPKPVRDRGITSGHVSVVLHVDPQGRVERVELLSASPPDVYDHNMEQVFAKWTFDPLGIPGRMTIDVDIRPPH